MMGLHPNISIDRFTKQGDWVGRRVEVCFYYNTKDTVWGTFVRDDAQEPYISIIKLDDGRHVLTTECQHREPIEPDNA